MKEETTKIKRKPRAKLMGTSGPLDCKPIPGFKLRWAAINNPQDPLNIQTLLARGYVPVTPAEQDLDNVSYGDLSSAVQEKTKDTIIRTGRDGISQMLMKIPVELYEEDLKELKAFNDSMVNAAAKPKQKNAIGLQEFGESIINGKPI